jgi:hypothetical protein
VKQDLHNWWHQTGATAGEISPLSLRSIAKNSAAAILPTLQFTSRFVGLIHKERRRNASLDLVWCVFCGAFWNYVLRSWRGAGKVDEGREFLTFSWTYVLRSYFLSWPPSSSISSIICASSAFSFLQFLRFCSIMGQISLATAGMLLPNSTKAGWTTNSIKPI